ncbi:MAG TPA: hypothetical protein VK694_05570 [Verrucomicrobiae bacterium]|nr:hypothetical protein [Verrucomicrobiae bacterium]
MADLTPEAIATVPYHALEKGHVVYLQQLDLDGLSSVIREALAQDPPKTHSWRLLVAWVLEPSVKSQKSRAMPVPPYSSVRI